MIFIWVDESFFNLSKTTMPILGCRRRSKNCLVLVTDCHNRTLTSVPNGIPSNSKAVLLNSNKIVNINLDGFQNFSELTVLTFGNNNALRFTLTQKLT